MKSSARMFMGIVFVLLCLGAAFMTVVLWGLSGLDTGPHLTPIMLAFGALTVSLLVAAIAMFRHGPLPKAIFFAPAFILLIILVLRFAQIG